MGINNLKRGTLVVIDSDPYLVMHISHQHIGRGGSSAQIKIKNLVNGKVFDRTFKSSDQFEEAEVTKLDSQFIYSRNNEFWFNESNKPSERFSIEEGVIGESAGFLKPKMAVRAVQFKGKIINVELPVKVEYEVTDAPPKIKGNTAQGGSKQVTIETGVKISTPMFIETGDVIRVNTETGEYVERV